MKINGEAYEVPVEEVVFSRPNNKFIVFQMKGILDMDAFDKMVIAPNPPVVRRPGKSDKVDATDPGFLAALKDYNQMRQDYIMVATIGSSPGVEWDKVKVDEADTWTKWEDELVSLGLVHFEIEVLKVAVMKANGMVGQMEEARDAFLASMSAQLRKEQEDAQSSPPAAS